MLIAFAKLLENGLRIFVSCHTGRPERKGKVSKQLVELSDEKKHKSFRTKKNICLYCAHRCRCGYQKTLRKKKPPKQCV